MPEEHRRLILNQTSVVSLRLSNVSESGKIHREILVRTTGRDQTFGALLPDDVKRYIAAVIQRKCSGVV